MHFIVNACAIPIVHACTMVLVIAYTMAIVHAYSVTIVHVSCPAEPVDPRRSGGGVWRTKPPGSMSDWGAAGSATISTRSDGLEFTSQ